MNVWRTTRPEPAEFALLMSAFLRVARTRLALWLLPWPRTMMLGNTQRRQTMSRFTAARLEWAVRSASRAVPRATCLTQALALNHLLTRHGYPGVVQIGVTNRDGRFAAHAWVECNGVPLLSSAEAVAQYARCLTWPAAPDVSR